VVAIVAVLVLALVGLYARAAARTNHVALSQSPKPVTTVTVTAASFQHAREYVGITAPWVEAKVGPQYVSAYVASVLYRPGATVRRNDVLATLDCRFTAAASRETAAHARSMAHRQRAQQHEAQRVQEMTAGGFASVNEVEQLRAKAEAESAQIESVRASLMARKIEVRDCVLRAPFDGDVLARFVDPGAYVRPGEPVMTVADRSTIIVAGDAPEDDFEAVAPGTQVAIDVRALKAKLRAPITRRTPRAEHATRTVHFEIDVRDPDRRIPVGATALLRVPVGEPEAVTQLPSRAATRNGDKATVFVVTSGVAHRREVPVVGYRGGMLSVPPKALPAGTQIVLDGRSLLTDGDGVQARPSETP